MKISCYILKKLHVHQLPANCVSLLFDDGQVVLKKSFISQVDNPDLSAVITIIQPTPTDRAASLNWSRTQ